MSRHREVSAAILIDTTGRFLLQQRDDIPGMCFPAWWGFSAGIEKAMRRS